MIFSYSLYSAILLISAIILNLLAWYIWKRREAAGGFYFSMLLVATADWALLNAIDTTGMSTSALLIYDCFLYAGFMAAPALWLLFALEFSNRSCWLTFKWRMVIWVVPVVMTVLVATNSWHGLVWSVVTLVSDSMGTRRVYGMGLGNWVITGYSVVLMLLGTFILIKKAMGYPESRRTQVWTLLLGALVPWIWTAIYATGILPFPDIDLAPVAMAVTGMILSWGIFRQHLFDVMPAAQETLITSMADGVLVLDSQKQILDINPAGYQLTGARGIVTKQPAETALEKWPVLEEYCRDYSEKSVELMLGNGEDARWLDTSISPLPDHLGQPLGLLIVMRDITDRKRAEKALHQAYDEVIEVNKALRAEVVDRQKAEEQIMASLHEKEVLLKEIHHRVKNNLQIISSLLSLQSGNVNKESAAAFNESRNRIKSMALIHEQLYQSTDLARIDFSGYIKSLTAHLVRSYVTSPNILIKLDIEDISLDLDVAMPCGLIINELTSNSLKYAFPDARAGIITITLKRAGEGYRLTVADDGKGMPPGIDYRDTASLGLQLVNVLVGQLKGVIEQDSSSGTSFTITFGVQRQKNDAGDIPPVPENGEIEK